VKSVKSEKTVKSENTAIILRRGVKTEARFKLDCDAESHRILKELSSASGLPIYRVTCELIKQAAPLVRIMD
jgi:hypothetical protein